MGSRADRLFRKFRRTGDPAALAVVFDRTAPEILRVAIHLAGGPAEAEDLVQETFVAAIEAAAAWDERRPVLPWLLGILANRAHKARERNAREPAPERLRFGTVADPAEEAEKTEFSEDLDRAIRTLPEPYPSVLVLHLRYGHSAAEIADALRRPPGTVRTQIVRGFELLRRTLPAGHRVGALVFARPLRGLAAVREAVLREASVGAAGLATATSVAPFVGALVMKQIWSAIGVVVLASGAWLAWPEQQGARDRVAGSSHVAPATRPAASERSDTGQDSRPRTAVLAERRSPSPAPTGVSGTVLLRLRWGDDRRTPAADVAVVVTPAGAESVLHRRQLRTDPDGTASVEDLEPVATSFEADRGGSAKLRVVAGQTSELELEIPRGLDVSGVVVDRGGNAVAGARVWLSRAPADVDEGTELAVVGRDGAFALRCVQPGRFISAFAEGFGAARLQKLAGQPGGALQVRLELGGTGGRVRGRVLGPDGNPVPGALILMGASYSLIVNYPPGHPLAPTVPGLSFRTDAQGEFVADGLTRGSSYPLWARAAGFAPTRDQVRVREQAETRVELRLRRGATLYGTASSRDREGARNVRVEVFSQETEPAEGMAWMGPAWGRPVGLAAEDGRFCIAGLCPGPALVTARGRSGKATSLLDLADGKETRWDPVLSAGMEIRGTVVNEAGAPLPGWTVHARALSGFLANSAATTDGEGRFVIGKCDDCGYRLTARDEKSLIKHAAATAENVRPAGDPVVLRVLDRELAAAFLTGQCLDADGKPPKGTSVQARRRGPDPFGMPGTQQEGMGQVDEANGRFRLGPLPSGVYDVRATSNELGAPAALEVHLEASAMHDLGVLQFDRPGSLLAEIKDSEGNPLPVGRSVVAQGMNGEMPFGAMSPIENGVARYSGGLAAGKYVFMVVGAKHPEHEVEIEIRSGEETRIQVNLARALMRRVRWTATTKKVTLPLEFIWTGPDGKVWKKNVIYWEKDRDSESDLWLVPGSHSVTVRAPDGDAVTSRFQVSENDASGEPAVIRLP